MKKIEDCNYIVRWYLAPTLKLIELSDRRVLWYWSRMLLKTRWVNKTRNKND